MWWWSFGIPALVGGMYLRKTLSERRRRLETWRQSAQSLSGTFEVRSSHFLSGPGITARSGPLEVRITGARSADNDVTVVIEGLADLSGVKLRRRFLDFWAHEIEVGDKAFDNAFIVEGPIRAAGALLEARTRQQLVRANEDCTTLEVGDGRLRAQFPERELPNLLPLLLGLGHRFAEPLDVEGRIFENARRDTEPGVRLFNLLLLAREHPGEPETLKALLDACSDESPRVRLRAAIELGDEGRDILLKLAEGTKDDDVSARAVSHLGDELPLGRARAILTHALRKNLTRTALAGLEVLGRRKDAAVSTLARVMRLEKGELSIAAARALGATGAEAAEPPLIQALQNEDDALREAAAAALGKVGSVAAVQPLEDAAERFWLDLGFRRSARQAIAEIQSRIEGAGASPGQLSIAAGDAGQLSLTEAEAGQLSLAQTETALHPHPSEDTEPPPRRVREKAAPRG